MCGIIGGVAKRNLRNILLEGLRRLEYRGYDSAGMAIVNPQLEEPMQIHKICGKVQALAAEVRKQRPSGTLGIAHTRWATHGGISLQNAHPHQAANRFALVHNGIIENFAQLRDELQQDGYEFSSETDSEVVVALISVHYQKTQDLLQALSQAIQRLEGTYSLVLFDKTQPDLLLGVRCGAPLIIGVGEEENFLASDPLALFQVTDRFAYMHEREIAVLTHTKVLLQDFSGLAKQVKVEVSTHEIGSTDRENYSHYMLKEISEQPTALTRTSSRYLRGRELNLEFLDKQTLGYLQQAKSLYLVGCGTSYHAAEVARYQFMEHLGLDVHTEVASEFRYMKRVIPPDCLYVSISQSGETADILAALRDVQAKQRAATANKKAVTAPPNDERNILATMAICNVPFSSLVRECDLSLLTAAGAEIGVASTKAFTTQLLTLAILLGMLLKLQKTTTHEKSLVAALQKLPAELERVLKTRAQIKAMATELAEVRSMMYIARGSLYPVAMEGALKLKEISYIHAEAYQGGELKHGPLALIDRNMPTVALVQQGRYYNKMKSNLQEIAARGGKLYVVTDKQDRELASLATQTLVLPPSHELLSPIYYTLPMQLLAYETAVLLGTDVDQPRNLAKSVTVE